MKHYIKVLFFIILSSKGKNSKNFRLKYFIFIKILRYREINKNLDKRNKIRKILLLIKVFLQ